MSNDEIDQPFGDNSVIVGNNPPVSMQVVQDIYKELTGKSEKLAKRFQQAHKVDFEDICQLNDKITQLYEQYNVQSADSSVTLYFADSSKSEFSSFERFKIYDGSSSIPVENIRLTYNVLITLPKAKNLQSYTMEIDISSRVGIQTRAHQEEDGIPNYIIRAISTQTGAADIKYVDYAVARNMLVTIEQWFEALPVSKSPTVLKRLKQNSHHIPFLFEYGVAFFLGLFFYLNADLWIPSSNALTVAFFKAGTLAFASIYLLSRISFRLGRAFENAIDAYQPISYLKLCRGDQTAIESYQKNNTKYIIRGVAALVLAIITNLAATWVATKVGFL